MVSITVLLVFLCMTSVGGEVGSGTWSVYSITGIPVYDVSWR